MADAFEIPESCSFTMQFESDPQIGKTILEQFE